MHKFFTILETMGDNSWTKSVRVVFLVPDTPTKCPLQPDGFLKIAQRVVRSCGVHNNAFMDRQMDGRIDFMLIAISLNLSVGG